MLITEIKCGKFNIQGAAHKMRNCWRRIEISVYSDSGQVSRKSAKWFKIYYVRQINRCEEFITGLSFLDTWNSQGFERKDFDAI